MRSTRTEGTRGERVEDRIKRRASNDNNGKGNNLAKLCYGGGGGLFRLTMGLLLLSFFFVCFRFWIEYFSVGRFTINSSNIGAALQ